MPCLPPAAAFRRYVSSPKWCCREQSSPSLCSTWRAQIAAASSFRSDLMFGEETAHADENIFVKQHAQSGDSWRRSKSLQLVPLGFQTAISRALTPYSKLSIITLTGIPAQHRGAALHSSFNFDQRAFRPVNFFDDRHSHLSMDMISSLHMKSHNAIARR